jgi:hypothetical protein
MIAAVSLGLLMAGGASVAEAASFSAHGSVGQVYATGLPASARVSLLNSRGATVAAQTTGSLGGALFRNVAPGDGYRVRLDSTGEQSDPVTVHGADAAPWDADVYNQTLPENGYGYLTTRDGTQLAINVHPPTSPAGEPGLPPGISLPNLPAHVPFTPPYPTLIEYSGYGYANPDGPTNGIAVLANLMGFAVVDVNMRGTGC